MNPPLGDSENIIGKNSWEEFLGRNLGKKPWVESGFSEDFLGRNLGKNVKTRQTYSSQEFLGRISGNNTVFFPRILGKISWEESDP